MTGSIAMTRRFANAIPDRRAFIGGSDARIIMGDDEAALSIITGGGKWVEMTIPADPLYQHLLLTAERKFWRCVQSGEPPSPLRH